jgi:hypothetical protein
VDAETTNLADLVVTQLQQELLAVCLEPCSNHRLLGRRSNLPRTRLLDTDRCWCCGVSRHATYYTTAKRTGFSSKAGSAASASSTSTRSGSGPFFGLRLDGLFFRACAQGIYRCWRANAAMRGQVGGRQ